VFFYIGGFLKMSFYKSVKRVAVLGAAFAVLNTASVFADAIVKVTGANVNIRSAASASSDVVNTVDTGLTLSVSSLKDGWFKLANSDGSEEYITTEYVKLTQADGVVNSAGVNIRKAPSANAEVVSTVNKDQKLAVTADVGEWYEVKNNDSFAYVHKDYISGDMLKYLPSKKVAVKVTPVDTNDTNSKGQEVVNFAKKYLGLNYVWGGTSLSSGVDCSGFMYCVYKNFGITLNRVSRDQINNGTRVYDKADLQPGDLIFFNTGGNSTISHVGMYMGNGQYIHATNNSKNCVQISSLNSSYAERTYVGACRVLK